MTDERPLWNVNIHYDRLLADLVPAGARVLDVGCGDGFLSAQLADRGCQVVGLDADRGVLDRAKARWESSDVKWVHGDLMDHQFEPGQFDAVLSNATLHHFPNTDAALRTVADLVAPGGVLGVVGLARATVLEIPRELVAAGNRLVLKTLRNTWAHTAPVIWPPPHTYGEVRTAAAAVLPGMTYRKLWLGRYLITWQRQG